MTDEEKAYLENLNKLLDEVSKNPLCLPILSEKATKQATGIPIIPVAVGRIITVATWTGYAVGGKLENGSMNLSPDTSSLLRKAIISEL